MRRTGLNVLRSASVLLIVGALSGCYGMNQNLSTLQLSSDAAPFPKDYLTIAAKVAGDRDRIRKPHRFNTAGIGG